jgi:hypothetical protein
MPPAQAQGLLEALFGPRHVPRDAVAMAPPPGVRITVHPRADTGLPGDGSAPTASGPYAAYCVRTCDGRFFPMPASSGKSEIERCRNLCPTADIKVFYGTSIDGAASSEGRAYNALPNAFRYRNELVDKCTCNGTSHLGLAKIAIADDPTLRVGDIVTDAQGILVVTETRSSARRGPRFRPLSAARARGYGIPTAALRANR